LVNWGLIVKNLSTNTKRQTEYFSRTELAARWGCHTETIRRREAAGEITPIRLPGGLRYRRADIEALEAAAGKEQG
jgi:hypothetical protein